MNRITDYDYELPPELIASTPAAQRDAARLLVVDRATSSLSHRTVRDLPELLRPRDCLVVNDTRVLPARLLGKRTATGGRWEGLFLGTTPAGDWRLLSQSRGRLLEGEQVTVIAAHAGGAAPLELTLLEREPEGGVFVFRPAVSEPALDLLQRYGTVPLPPYIERELATPDDFERYQTTYAARPGAVAAPTAGLHLTPELFQRCEARRIARASVTLHVGIGTFRPVSVERLDDHRMHAEWCEVPQATVERLRETREAGGRIVAVGTTTVRTLESAARAGKLTPWQGETDIFIRPSWTFRSVDCLLTNFHLPRSTLLVLVSALAGRELIRKAYEEAISQRYRFFSYGDAMLIV